MLLVTFLVFLLIGLGYSAYIPKKILILHDGPQDHVEDMDSFFSSTEIHSTKFLSFQPTNKRGALKPFVFPKLIDTNGKPIYSGIVIIGRAEPLTNDEAKAIAGYVEGEYDRRGTVRRTLADIRSVDKAITYFNEASYLDENTGAKRHNKSQYRGVYEPLPGASLMVITDSKASPALRLLLQRVGVKPYTLKLDSVMPADKPVYYPVSAGEEFGCKVLVNGGNRYLNSVKARIENGTANVYDKQAIEHPWMAKAAHNPLFIEPNFHGTEDAIKLDSLVEVEAYSKKDAKRGHTIAGVWRGTFNNTRIGFIGDLSRFIDMSIYGEENDVNSRTDEETTVMGDLYIMPTESMLLINDIGRWITMQTCLLRVISFDYEIVSAPSAMEACGSVFLPSEHASYVQGRNFPTHLIETPKDEKIFEMDGLNPELTDQKKIDAGKYGTNLHDTYSKMKIENNLEFAVPDTEDLCKFYKYTSTTLQPVEGEALHIMLELEELKMGNWVPYSPSHKYNSVDELVSAMGVQAGQVPAEEKVIARNMEALKTGKYEKCLVESRLNSTLYKNYWGRVIDNRYTTGLIREKYWKKIYPEERPHTLDRYGRKVLNQNILKNRQLEMSNVTYTDIQLSEDLLGRLVSMNFSEIEPGVFDVILIPDWVRLYQLTLDYNRVSYNRINIVREVGVTVNRFETRKLVPENWVWYVSFAIIIVCCLLSAFVLILSNKETSESKESNESAEENKKQENTPNYEKSKTVTSLKIVFFLSVVTMTCYVAFFKKEEN